MQQLVGFINEIMNVNPWMVVNLTIVAKEMANEKLGVTTEPSPESLWGLYICAVGWLYIEGFAFVQCGLTF